MAKKRPRTKGRAPKPKPKVVSILFCDQALREEHTQKYTLVGIFTSFHSSKYPAVFPKFFVHLVFSNLGKKHIIEITIRKSGTRKIARRMTGAIEGKGTKEPDDHVGVVFPIENLKFDEPEKYIFSFKLDGRTIGKRVIKTEKR